MKLPLSWLAAHVDLASTSVARDDGSLDVDALVDVMSLNGLEVEEVTTPGAGTSGVRTARVLDWAPHPDADKLRVAHVTGEGGDGSIELVCGAANFDVGDVVAHAFPGSSVPGMEMAQREIRGVVSNGMLASARELQLGDDHDGILVLPAGTPLGVAVTDLLPLGEPVIEVAVQADRGDHHSVLGVARDLAAILDTTWSAPEVPDALPSAGVPVELATDGCASFVAWTLEDVRVQASPLWLQQRLAQCGIRSIDVVVDVTNYVMLELGQPLHAFDLDRLKGPALTVRRSTGGDQLTTLDDRARVLEAGDMVIDDAQGPVSLAGVMGGRDTEVSATTTRVLLEAAVWEPASIRATSRRLNLVSEASQRYERRVDPDGAGRGAARAVQLLVELAGARPVATTVVRTDPAPTWTQLPPVEIDTERVRRLLAVEELDTARQAALLARAGAAVDDLGDGRLRVSPPSWRGDLTREADLAEEVARLHGYEAIPAQLPALATTGGLTAGQRAEREVRDLARAAGFHEAVTRPFVGDDALEGLVPTTSRVELANPLAKDAAAMRPTLLEGLLQAVRRNAGQGRAGTALFELGRVFRPVDDRLAAALDGARTEVGGQDWRWRDPRGAELPIQPRALGVVAQGLRAGEDWLDVDARWSVHDVLAVLDEVALRLAPTAEARRLERVPVEREGFHPGRTVALLLGGHEVGLVGQLHPDEADRRDLPEPVAAGELLLEPFLRAVDAGAAPVTARPLVKHPALTIDVALVADDPVPYARLEAAIRRGAGELLDGLWWFDEYRGEQVGAGRRSVAVRLRLQAPDRQLTEDDEKQVIEAVAAAAEEAGATLRR
ncbi:phenylalanine--tRNA ligase subunit beta [Nitriliruptor alkaliphilus]|uniref:phenylalanine--tRNA ligase subunit beta n=1 Tax=Nitriliruptor alkaliphilus TaxID=427918 RepID=UPI000697CA29|nr:phenylalanine--tRNA ligase subunit beta [Nitriliruptor alkaliphilus]